MPDPMTTPGQEAAIEAAAKACGSTIPWATLAIDAYERVLARGGETLACSSCGGTMRRGESYFCDCGAILGHRCEQPADEHEDGMKTKRDWSL